MDVIATAATFLGAHCSQGVAVRGGTAEIAVCCGPMALDLAQGAASPIWSALIADRDADSRAMYAEFLRYHGFDVDEVEDGRDALARALKTFPDVLIAETRLPGISGLDLCRLLRQDPHTRDMVIVFVTADAMPPEVKAASSAGADSVLVKPCPPERLTSEVDRLLQRSREAHDRPGGAGETVSPPTAPPALTCPVCDQPLTYRKSHLGGVNARSIEQWDYFDCPRGCGTFQYRQRTRKLRHIRR
jgi:CheY-like chemotaxis protein